MKIYTRKKKPKLYGLLIFSAAVLGIAALLVALSQTTHVNTLPYLTLMLPAYFAAVVVIIVISLKRQLEYNPYSYNTIYYFGFALFVTSVLITHIIAAVRYFTGEAGYGLRETARLILNSARMYMVITLPLLSVFSVGLLISNIVLIKKEGGKLTNILGIILAVMMMGGGALLIWLGSVVNGWADAAVNLLCAVFIYAECMLFGTIFAGAFSAVHTPAFDKDYIIILGCRVSNDGTPTPVLRDRVDNAIDFYDLQMAATGRSATFVASGGKGDDEHISEAECMRNYIISKGFLPEQVILEDRSRNTLENMKYSFEKIPENAKCAFSTTNYHVFRSGIAANRACKFKAEGTGAKAKWYFWPNAAVREFIGLLTGHRGKQLLVLSGLLVIYMLLAMLAG